MQNIPTQAVPHTESPDGAQARPLTSDPQFWIATVIAIVAAAFLLRGVLPRLGLRAKKPAATKTSLTVGGKAIRK